MGSKRNRNYYLCFYRIKLIPDTQNCNRCGLPGSNQLQFLTTAYVKIALPSSPSCFQRAYHIEVTELGAGALENSRRWHSYLPLSFTGWTQDSALEFTAFHTAVLAISSEIFTTKGSVSELHAKMKTHTHTHKQKQKEKTGMQTSRQQDRISAGEADANMHILEIKPS